MVESEQQDGENGDEVALVESACTQLGDIIRGYIRHSMGDSGYGRAVEALGVMREEALEREMPGVYNDFMGALKRELLAGELGGERMEMWFLLRKRRMGLIVKKETLASHVDEDGAKAFLSAR